MGINRLSAPSSSPAGIGDWTAVVNQLAALVLDKEEPVRVSGSNVLKGAFFNVGGVLYVADADTAISGTASDYVKITPAGATASAAFVASLSGVAWNSTYKGYYDGSGNLYVLDRVTAPMKQASEAGDYIIPGFFDRDGVSLDSATVEKVYEIKSPCSGTIRVSFSIYCGVEESTAYARIYKNGVAFGTARSQGLGSSSYYEDLAFTLGDLIQIYGYVTPLVAATVNKISLSSNGCGTLRTLL